MPAPVRVLVVDDSPSVRRVLVALLRAAPGVQVVGTAASGEEAVERVLALAPNVVTLDLDMPGIGGLVALGRIMARRPTPVILLSGVSGRAVTETVLGLARGAVDFVTKYTPGRDTNPAQLGRELVAKVRVAARANVVRQSIPRARAPIPVQPGPASGVIVVGASTGGPAALREFLAGLSRPLPVGVLVVQHLPRRFTATLAALLGRQSGLLVREARDGDALEPGRVLIAPGDFHATLTRNGRVRLGTGPAVNGHRPSIDVAMSSATALGARAAGVLLTGMGYDGARGLAAIRAAGGRTFAQNEASCAVYGMPRRAAELGAAGEVDTPAGFAQRLFGQGDSTWWRSESRAIGS